MNIMLPLSPPEMEALHAISLVRSRKATISEVENRLVAYGFIMSTPSYVRITRAGKLRVATERSLQSHAATTS